jgi:hypothetical protein
MLVKLQKLYSVDRHGKMNGKYMGICKEAVAAYPKAVITPS